MGRYTPAMADAGRLASPRGLARGNHLCWVYERHSQFRRRAIAFLTEGFVAGHRLEFIGGQDHTVLRRELGRVAGLDVLLERGVLVVRGLDDQYGAAGVVDPRAAVAAYASATAEALRAGYTGLRVVADATALVRTPAQRDAFARYEHLVDRYMVDHPFFALCAYDARAIGRQPAAEIACLHPRVNNGVTTFQWYATEGADVGLSGQIDITNVEVFDVTLARTMPLLAGPRLVVDAGGLEFIDHRGMLALEQHAEENGTQVTLRTNAAIVHRFADLLALRAVRPEWSR